MTPPPPAAAAQPLDISYWLRPPLRLCVAAGAAGLAVALAVFPIIRRLLIPENLQRSGGSSLPRAIWPCAPTQGQDEVADLPPVLLLRPSASRPWCNRTKACFTNRLARAAPAAGAHPHGVETDGRCPEQRSAQQEIRRNTVELDQLVDEIALPGRLEQPDDVGSSDGCRSDRLSAAEECARVDADLQLHTTALEVLTSPDCCAARAQFAGNAKRYSQGSISLELRRC